jgi:hypothetical protein
VEKAAPAGGKKDKLMKKGLTQAKDAGMTPK